METVGNSNLRGKDICLGYCVNHTSCGKNLKDVTEKNLMYIWRMKVTVTSLLDGVVYIDDGKSQYASRVSIERTVVTFMGLMRKEQAPRRRYENAKEQLKDKKLGRQATSRKNTFLAQNYGSHHGTWTYCWDGRQLGRENPINISYLFDENTQ